MARTTTPTSKRKTGGTRGTKPAAVEAPRSSVAKKTTPARKAAAPAKSKAAARAPTQSKQELRDRIEKLERANVVLRAKNREAVEASREAANRIDQLEEQLGRNTGRDVAPISAKDTPADEAPAKPAARRGRKPKPAPVVDEPVVDEAHDEEI